MTDKTNLPLTSNTDVSEFLKKVASTPVRAPSATTGRILFALDATASREPTWDRACHIQSEMFKSTDSLGSLQIQLCYYRGFNQFRATKWCSDTNSLLQVMTSVHCQAGQTQVEKVLRHALDEARSSSIQAVIFIGDAVEENPDALCTLAGQLGLVNLPLFIFQEGQDPLANSTFAQMARITGGARCHFDASSAEELKNLLRAVAVYAVGGHKALEILGKKGNKEVLKLTQQIGRKN